VFVKVRLLLLIAVVVATAGAAPAAPAPLPRKQHHVPSPDTLLANFRAEGYDVRSLERGTEPGTYVLTTVTPTPSGRRIRFQLTKHTVRVDGSDVRAPLREVLEGARQAFQAALNNQLEEW
jgi:hypothetical protein